MLFRVLSSGIALLLVTNIAMGDEAPADQKARIQFTGSKIPIAKLGANARLEGACDEANQLVAALKNQKISPAAALNLTTLRDLVCAR